MRNFLSNINSQDRLYEIRRKIFVQCVVGGQSTISQISKALNLSVPTVAKNVQELCDDGFFIDYGKEESKEGRPASVYGVNPNSCYFIGVDITPIQLSMAIVDLNGIVVSFFRNKNFVFKDDEETLDHVCEQVKSFIDKAHSEGKVEDLGRILNINVNIIGRVNSKNGYSYSAFNMGERSLSSVLTEKLGIATTIENDTRAKTYGEYHEIKKVGGRSDLMLCINADLGIAMGAVIDGKLLDGKSGFAGELGHTYAFDNEIICYCGKKGCLETEISGKALLREALARINSGSQSVLSSSVKSGKEVSIYDVIDAISSKEDMLCIEILEDMGFKLGRTIANLINIFNPDTIVISGILSQTEDFILNPVKMSVKKHVLTLVGNDTKIVVSSSKGSKAGVIGACLISRNKALGIQV